jgi:hypothetical protein
VAVDDEQVREAVPRRRDRRLREIGQHGRRVNGDHPGEVHVMLVQPKRDDGQHQQVARRPPPALGQHAFEDVVVGGEGRVRPVVLHRADGDGHHRLGPARQGVFHLRPGQVVVAPEVFCHFSSRLTCDALLYFARSQTALL